MKINTIQIAFYVLVCGSVFAQERQQASVSAENSIEFIPNKGQFADKTGKLRKDILYLSHAGPVEVYLRDKGLSYVVNTIKNPHMDHGFLDDHDSAGQSIWESHHHWLKLRNEHFKTCRIDMDFVGASEPATENIQPTDGYLNYYYPHCPNGVTKVKAYENVLYKNIYHNIDLSFKGTFGKGLKYDIIINPGGNPDKLRMKYTGTENVEILDGKLELTAFTGKMEERIPKIYQEINGQQVIVDGHYVLYHQGKDSLDGTIVGIEIKNYDKNYPVVIDPWWATYCGGSSDDEGYACVLDNLGNTLVAGTVSSTDFPSSIGAFQTSLVGNTDAFVVKLDQNGRRLWATYYGAGSDGAYGIASDNNNNVFITGNTSSPAFPVSGGAFQPVYGGAQDAFAVKFDPNGVRLWGTFCGGSGLDEGNAITTDNAGNVAIAGYTLSSNFPVSGSAFQSTYGGDGPFNYGDAFVVKFDPNGNQLWGTYFGGSKDDGAFGIAADSRGNFAITGLTGSINLPITAGCFQNTPGSAFVGEFDPNGNQLWATYFGGLGDGCAIDKSNNVVIAGSSGGGYPYYSFPYTPIVATPGVYQTALTTGKGFAAKFSPTGSRIWATFNNTNVSEGGDYAMTVDEGNNVYLEDDEEPPSYTGPACAFEQNYTNRRECLYIVKLDSNAKFTCSTYTSGSAYDEHEYACSNLSAKNGRLAIAGYTSGGIPTTAGVMQTAYPGGAFDPFVFNICSFACGDTIPPVLSVANIIVRSDSCSGYVGFSAHASAPCDSAGATFLWSFPGGNPSSATGPNISNILYTTPGTYTVKLKYIACSADSLTQTFTTQSGFHDSLAVTNPSNCHQKGKATAYPSAGDAPYTYSWSNGKTTQSDTALGAGTYTCVVIAHNGCRDTTVFRIETPISPGFNLKPKHDTGFCAGGSVTLSVSGGSGFNWAPSAGLSCTACPNPIASPTAVTTYTVDGIDSVGCPDSAKITVEIDSVPVFSITATQEGCGGYTYLDATSSNDYTWTWAPPTWLSFVGTHYNDANPPVRTTYTLTAFNGFCSKSDTITVDPVSNTFPLKIIASPDTICQGGIISLSTTPSIGIISWSWYAVNGVSCPSCSNPTLNTGVLSIHSSTYTIAVQAENTDSCIAVDTLVLHIIPYHVNKNSIEICKGSSATLSAYSSSSYLWNTGATTSSITVSPPTSTNYYVLVDSAGCQDSIFRTVIVDPGPVINVSTSKDTVCKGSNAALVALGNNVVNWLWTPNIGLSCNTCHVTLATITSEITYTITATDSVGCSTVDSLTLYVSPSASVYKNYSICQKDSIILSVSDGNTYLWSNGATTSTIKVSPPDTTTYYSVITFNGGCHDTIFQTVDIVPYPVPAIRSTSAVCKGKEDTLYASGGSTYLWGSGSTSSSIIVTLTKDSTVTLQASNGACHKDTTIKLTLAPSPTVTIAPPPQICSGDSVSLSAKGGGSYHWNTGSTDSTIVVYPKSTSNYTVVVTNSLGCTATSSAIVSVGGPSLFACCDSTILNGNSAVLYADSSYKYTWYPSAGISCDSCQQIIVTPTVTTTYTVIGKDINGCQTSRIITIIVEPPCSNYSIPNVFTPNGDGIDDDFEIKVQYATSYSIIIYDRWGKEMYSSTDPTKYWDGSTESGGQAPSGVYYYIINSTCRNTNYKKDGYVQLIR